MLEHEASAFNQQGEWVLGIEFPSMRCVRTGCLGILLGDCDSRQPEPWNSTGWIDLGLRGEFLCGLIVTMLALQEKAKAQMSRGLVGELHHQVAIRFLR